jgi:hypothetical protein
MWQINNAGGMKLYEYSDAVNDVVYCVEKDAVTRQQVRGGHLAYGEYEVFKSGTLKYDSLASMFAAMEDGIYRSHKYWERMNAFYSIKSLAEIGERIRKNPRSSAVSYLKYSPKTYRSVKDVQE